MIAYMDVYKVVAKIMQDFALILIVIQFCNKSLIVLILLIIYHSIAYFMIFLSI